jgi:phage/plasmid-like protein (TIGR03299 family)
MNDTTTVLEGADTPAETTPDTQIIIPPKREYGEITGTTSMEEAIEFGDLDFEVEVAEIRFADASPEEENIKQFVSIRRTDNRGIVFNCPTKGYRIIQNREVMAFAHPLVEAANGKYHRVGFFKNGASIFAIAELPEKIVLGEEEVTPHLVIQSSHDGSASISLSFLGIRPSDGSLMPMMSAGTRHAVAYRHTKNAQLRLDQVSALIEIKNRFFQVLRENSEKLIGAPMTLDDATAFVNKYLSIPEDPAAVVPDKKQEIRETILGLFRNLEMSATVRDTRYAMLMAISNYRTHKAPTRAMNGSSTPEARFASVLNGTGADEVDKAWTELLKNLPAKVEVAEAA